MGYGVAPAEAEANTPAEALPGTKPSISQTASLLLALTISVEIPFIIAMNVASASLSEMFFAIVNPSHHRVVAGVDPPATVGALASTVLLVIFEVEPLSSRIVPPLVPHMVAKPSFPASHNAAVAFESNVRKSGFEYSVSDLIILSAATPLALLTLAIAVPGLNNWPL